ncbi:MAG: hypothetical protein ACK48Y_00285, partial [Planctomyces sp.]
AVLAGTKEDMSVVFLGQVDGSRGVVLSRGVGGFWCFGGKFCSDEWFGAEGVRFTVCRNSRKIPRLVPGSPGC